MVIAADASISTDFPLRAERNRKIVIHLILKEFIING